MSFWPFELSRFGGKPVELYEFTDGPSVWRYTHHAKPITWDGHTWAAENISHSEIKSTSEIARTGVSITLPRTAPLAGEFLGYPRETVMEVTIRRGHANDPEAEYFIIWKGRVVARKPGGQSVALECQSVFAQLRRAGLGPRFQKVCNHALYDADCGVDKADFATAGTVDAVDGASVSVAAAAGQADGYFSGGMIEFEGVFRTIQTHVGADLTIFRPINGMAVSDDVTLYPGCDRTDTTCGERFGNLDNQLAFKWIPEKNPMGGSSIL